jgi:hypothetical protein
MPDDTPNAPQDPGAGTPGAGGPPPSPVAAGSPDAGGSSPTTGVLPPNGGAIPSANVKQIGKEAVGIDVVRACILALENQAIPNIFDREFKNAVHEAVVKLSRYVPSPGEHDDHAGSTRKITEAILARRAAAGGGPGAGGGPPPTPGGRPPGVPQLPSMPGAPPGATPPPTE